MIQKSEAIVLSRFPYSESSIISKCFLKDFGKVSFIIHGAKNKKNFKSSYFQPGNFIEILFYNKSNRNMQTVAKTAFIKQWKSISKDLIKISYVMAIIELTEKCIKDYDANKELFDQLLESILIIDKKQDQLNLVFWNYQYQLLRILGFKPDFEQPELDMNLLPNPFDGPNSKNIFTDFEKRSIDFNSKYKITNGDRSSISSYLNRCLGIHFEGVDKLKSFEVLKQCIA